MTLSSMTGFGRAEGHFETYSWTWEIRSVNGKTLDIRVRIPSGLDAMDQHIKNTLKNHIARGNVNVSLQLQKESSDPALNINEDALNQLVNAAKEAAKKHDLPMPSIDRLLSIRDVVAISDMPEDDETIDARDGALKTSFLTAVESFKDSRNQEGEATFGMLSNILDEFEKLLEEAEKVAATQPHEIKKRFEEKVGALIDNIQGFEQERVTQEVVILATKADVKEETDRLRAHISSARTLLRKSGPVGRKLEFLSQEFNRETNTLCSKSSDITLTNIGLSLKAAIDQFREQILNVE